VEVSEVEEGAGNGAPSESRARRVVLFRCPAPTDLVCPCGKVARSLRRAGVEFETRKVTFFRRHRPEIRELTGQDRVPVLVHGEEVVHDSRRITEYVEREFRTR
jgi:glutaredoxin